MIWRCKRASSAFTENRHMSRERVCRQVTEKEEDSENLRGAGREKPYRSFKPDSWALTIVGKEEEKEDSAL